MTQEELDRLEALAKAATGGPWEVGDPYNSRSMALVAVYGMGMEVADTQQEADAAFIAAARDAVPALVAEVKRLRGLVREAYCEGWHDQFSERAGAYHATAIGKTAVTDMESEGWDESDARKAMEGA